MDTGGGGGGGVPPQKKLIDPSLKPKRTPLHKLNIPPPLTEFSDVVWAPLKKLMDPS